MKEQCIGGAFSGGGAHGSWMVGVQHALYDIHGIEFHKAAGSSTGNLTMGLAALNDYESLRKAYTSQNNDTIYKVDPFKKGKGGDNDLALNIWSFLRMRWIEKEPTFGDSSKLKGLIDQFFTYQDYTVTRKSGIELYSCVVNLTKRRKEFYSNMDGEGTRDDYEAFKHWVWVSTLAVPFTSIFQHPFTDDYYVDAGFMEHIPIQRMINAGCDKIFAISTAAPFDINRKLDLGNDVLKLVREIIAVALHEVAQNDFEIAKLEAFDRNVEIVLIKPETAISPNSMNFDKKKMTEWYEMGYNHISESKVDISKPTIKLRKPRVSKNPKKS